MVLPAQTYCQQNNLLYVLWHLINWPVAERLWIFELYGAKQVHTDKRTQVHSAQSSLVVSIHDCNRLYSIWHFLAFIIVFLSTLKSLLEFVCISDLQLEKLLFSSISQWLYILEQKIYG